MSDFWKDYEPVPTRPAPMTTDKALDLALEALEESVDLVREDYENAKKLYSNYPSRQARLLGLEDGLSKHEAAITVIKQARSAPVQSCYCPNCEAMGKELAALKAQPAVPLTDDWIRSKCKQTWVFETAKQWVRMTEEAHGITAAPVQEPVGVYGHCPVCGAKGVTRERRPDGDDCCANGHTYKSIHATTPSAAPVQELVCHACESIEWEVQPCPICQPAPVQELQRYSPNGEGGMEVDSLGAYVKLQDVTTPPTQPAPAPGYCKHCKQYSIEEPLPAAQRQWVGLTDKQMVDAIEPLYQNRATVEMAAKVSIDEFRAIEAKLKEKNT